jgi:hypothetical protein
MADGFFRRAWNSVVGTATSAGNAVIDADSAAVKWVTEKVGGQEAAATSDQSYTALGTGHPIDYALLTAKSNFQTVKHLATEVGAVKAATRAAEVLTTVGTELGEYAVNTRERMQSADVIQHGRAPTTPAGQKPPQTQGTSRPK